MPYNPEVSHRGYNLKCVWWSRRENSFEYEAQPNGFFYAREEEGKQYNRDNFMGNNMIMMERTNINIKSPDNLSKIKIDDKIEFEGEKWFVSAINRERVRKQQSEFTNYKKVSYYWILNLRK